MSLESSQNQARPGLDVFQWSVLVGLAAFVALYASAMAVYPGGTWNEPHAVGHRFWGNFFCDVQRPVALNGQPNPIGSRLGATAALVLYATWVPLWLRAPRVIGGGPLASLVRALGITAAALSFAIPCCFSHHAFVVLAAAGPGLAALTIAVVFVLRRPGLSRWLRGSTALFAALALLHAFLYVRSLLAGNTPPILPAIQKLAAMALVAWMAAWALE